jgi:hypothetical protein
MTDPSHARINQVNLIVCHKQNISMSTTLVALKPKIDHQIALIGHMTDPSHARINQVNLTVRHKKNISIGITDEGLKNERKWLTL